MDFKKKRRIYMKFEKVYPGKYKDKFDVFSFNYNFSIFYNLHNKEYLLIMLSANKEQILFIESDFDINNIYEFLVNFGLINKLVDFKDI
jgi:hypothetical protein